MDNLITSINISFPLIFLLALGKLLHWLGLIDERFIRTATGLVFNVCFPCSIFSNFLGMELSAVLNARMLLFQLAAIAVSMLLPTLLVPIFVRNRRIAASMAQAMFRTNVLIQGIPLMTAAYGSANIASALCMLPFLILLNNVLATLIFVLLIPDDGQDRSSPVLASLKKMAVNPLILACAAGLIFSLLHLRLPAALAAPVSQLGAVASPLALLCMGAELHPDTVRFNLRYTLPTALVRLVLLPGIITFAAYCFGFRGSELGCLFLFNATCSAASGYIMAGQLGGDTDIAAQSVALTAMLSSLTLTAGIFILLELGFM